MEISSRNYFFKQHFKENNRTEKGAKLLQQTKRMSVRSDVRLDLLTMEEKRYFTNSKKYYRRFFADHIYEIQ